MIHSKKETGDTEQGRGQSDIEPNVDFDTTLVGQWLTIQNRTGSSDTEMGGGFDIPKMGWMLVVQSRPDNCDVRFQELAALVLKRQCLHYES